MQHHQQKGLRLPDAQHLAGLRAGSAAAAGGRRASSSGGGSHAPQQRAGRSPLRECSTVAAGAASPRALSALMHTKMSTLRPCDRHRGGGWRRRGGLNMHVCTCNACTQRHPADTSTCSRLQQAPSRAPPVRAGPTGTRSTRQRPKLASQRPQHVGNGPAGRGGRRQARRQEGGGRLLGCAGSRPGSGRGRLVQLQGRCSARACAAAVAARRLPTAAAACACA